MSTSSQKKRNAALGTEQSWTSPMARTSSPLRRSRRTAVMTTMLITLIILCIDKFLVEWAPEMTFESFEWLLDDHYVIFYLFGIGAGYTCCCRLQKSSRQPKASPKCIDSPTDSKVRSQRCFSKDDVKVAPSESPSGTRPGTASRLNYTLAQAALREDASKVAKLLQNMEQAGWESNVNSYNIVIRSYVKMGHIEQAKAWLRRIFQSGLRPNEQTYLTFIQTFVKAEDLTSAENWMYQMEQAGIQATSTTFSLLIHALTRLGNLGKAEAWLRRMIDAGITPNASNYNSFIHACSLQCNAERAEQWLLEMLEKDLEPSVMTYTAVVDACAKSLDVPRAERWMTDMLARGVEPNVVSYSSMINACAKVGQLPRAEYWYNQMQSKGVQPNAYSYSALINACAKVGDVVAARAWLQRAERSDVVLDSVVYGCVINACSKVNDCDGAMAVFKQMRSRGIESHIVIYSSLARPFAYRGDWEIVEGIAESLQADGFQLNDYFLYAMLLAYSRSRPRQNQKAEEAYLKAVRGGLQVNDRIFKVLVQAAGRQRATQLVEDTASAW
jgi:pentatricopeptide repeat protein